MKNKQKKPKRRDFCHFGGKQVPEAMICINVFPEREACPSDPGEENTKGAGGVTRNPLEIDLRAFSPEKKIVRPEWIQGPSDGLEFARFFFQACHLETWRGELWQWLQVVSTEGLIWSHALTGSDGDSLLYNYTHFMTLVEWAFKARAKNELAGVTTAAPTFTGIVGYHEPIRARYKDKVVLFKYISTEEALAPESVLMQVTSAFQEDEWAGILFEWLEYGLSESTNVESNYGQLTMRIYVLLNRLLEASFLIAFGDDITIEKTEHD